MKLNWHEKELFLWFGRCCWCCCYSLIRTRSASKTNSDELKITHTQIHSTHTHAVARKCFYMHKPKKKMKVENFRDFLFLSFSTGYSIGAVICWNYFSRYFHRQQYCKLSLKLCSWFMLFLFCEWHICGCHWRFQYWLLLFSFTFPVSFWLWSSYIYTTMKSALVDAEIENMSTMSAMNEVTS